ncbi:MAG: hypothetical protein COT18_08850 [Elusimicrobia bacterium CG08_land_8_20_14_0_20_59_10]|nr:MAG: hypothetical protein COT18_08850 [Elusimicrobia bacterium CG08_land_8_20_14_0_20_59_10]
MTKNKIKALIILLLTAGPVLAVAGGKAAPGTIDGFTAVDMPYDAGASVLLKWPVGPSDSADASYVVYGSSLAEGGWRKGEEFVATAKTCKDINLPFWAWDSGEAQHALKVELNTLFGDIPPGTPLKFKAQLLRKGSVEAESPAVDAASKSNWFRLDRLNNLLFLLVMIVIFFWAVSHAKRKGLFIRRIAGLDAIDEAIGRATEMGKPIFYVPGIGTMSSISTIASAFILGEVSKKVAQYDSDIKIPHYDPIVMTVCKEIVKQSYLEAGRPDSYREDMNFFVSADQFSYAASVDGMISREKPAACFFMGYFMAESLLLAEVGAASGAIQIAGTDIESQLPFFFTACDYTLIGEELYAAGAYLSKEPMLVSALKVQDFGKLVVMASVSLGIVLVSLGTKLHWDFFVRVILNLFKAY